jgi:hypothetical protein
LTQLNPISKLIPEITEYFSSTILGIILKQKDKTLTVLPEISDPDQRLEVGGNCIFAVAG